MSKLDELTTEFRSKAAAVIADVTAKGHHLEIEPIYGGRRTQEQQRKIVGAGHSKTLHSYHLSGEAADLYERTDGKLHWPSKRAQFLIGSSAWVHDIGWGGMFDADKERLKEAIRELRKLAWTEEHHLYATPVGWDACHIQIKANF